MELFKPVAGFEGLYEVSSEGRVFAVDKKQRYLLRNKAEAFRFIPRHEISSQLNNRGYKIVHLYRNNKRYIKTVHRLVALAFLEQTAQEVDHINRDRSDARLVNLRWLSVSENRRRGAR